MNTYRLHDTVFATTFELPELESAAGTPEFTVIEQRLPPLPDNWIDPWERDPRGPLIRVQRHDGYRVRYDGQVDFHLSADGCTLAVDVADCAPATLRHFLLDQVIPLVLSTRSIVLHASANIVDGHAVAFAGPCGAGKSTLATMLGLQGHAIAADDALVLRPEGRYLSAAPAYPGVRLWPDMVVALTEASHTAPVSEVSTKRRVRSDLRFHHHGTAPLGTIYHLSGEDSARVTFAPLSLRDTAMLFIEFGFRLEQRDPVQLIGEMDRACDAAARVRAWSVRYPRSVSDRQDVAAEIVAHARTRSTLACCS